MRIEDLALVMTRGLGAKGVAHLLEVYGEAVEVFAATESDLIEQAEMRAEVARAIVKREERKRDAESLAMEIWRRFCDGMTPSEIDRDLRLPEGNAHDVIVHEWRLDVQKQPSLVTMGGSFRHV